MKIFRSFFYKDKRVKSDFKKDIPMNWNIYDGKNVSVYSRRFWWVHYFLKYKVIVPLLWIFRALCGKKLNKDIPDHLYNKNLKIFDKAWNKSINEWTLHFLLRDYLPEKKARHFDRMMTSDNVVLLNTTKEIMYTIILNDTAYREYFNMLMYNIGEEMAREYKGQKIKHFMYHEDSVYDHAYYIATMVQNGIEVKQSVDTRTNTSVNSTSHPK